MPGLQPRCLRRPRSDAWIDPVKTNRWIGKVPRETRNQDCASEVERDQHWADFQPLLQPPAGHNEWFRRDLHYSGQGRDRTADTWIFRDTLNHAKTAKFPSIFKILRRFARNAIARNDAQFWTVFYRSRIRGGSQNGKYRKR